MSALREESGIRLEPADARHWEQVTTAARSLLPEPPFETVWAEGRTMSLEECIAYAQKEQ